MFTGSLPRTLTPAEVQHNWSGGPGILWRTSSSRPRRVVAEEMSRVRSTMLRLNGETRWSTGKDVKVTGFEQWTNVGQIGRTAVV